MRDMPKAVYIDSDSLKLEVSVIRPKYGGKEKAPFVMILNKEIDLDLRLILEDFI